MTLRPLALPGDVPGRLWLGPMPGRFDSWQAFLQEASRRELRLVVCLTPREEVLQLSPHYHAAVSGGSLPFRWLQVPVRNYGVPADAEAFRRRIAEIAAALRQGEGVMLHCAAGIGRTGTAAACVLKTLGVPAQEALQRVRDAGSNPENARQSGVVDWF